MTANKKTRPFASQILHPGKIKTIKYKGGKTRYCVIGHPDPKNTLVVIVPGWSRGLLAFYRFATLLNQETRRQVIILDQPEHHSLVENLRRGRLRTPLSALDHQSEALLAVLKDAKAYDKPVDFIAHSFGAMVLWRASQLGHRRGFKSFESKSGSHAIFLAPSGTYAYDDLTNLGKRFFKHYKYKPPRNDNDLDKLISKSTSKNVLKQPLKHLREAVTLGKKKISYAQLNKIGLQPMIFSFSDDQIFPHEMLAKAVDRHEGHIYGYSRIIGSGAHHDDPIFTPSRTIKAILPSLNGSEHSHKR